MNSKYYIQHHLWLSPNISNMSLCISAPLMVAGPSSSSRSFWMGRRLKLAIIIINSVRPCAWIKVINLHHHFTIRYWKSHSLGFGRDWVNLVQQRQGKKSVCSRTNLYRKCIYPEMLKVFFHTRRPISLSINPTRCLKPLVIQGES